MQWVKSRPRHMPRRWVMKCSLPEFIGNRGSFVCNAHECLDKIVPRNANLWNSSSLRGGRTSWRVPERDRGFGSAGHFFSLAKKWLQASAQCTTSRCSAGMPLLSRLWRRRMEKSYRRESLSMVDLGSTSLFWIWWDTAVYTYRNTIHTVNARSYITECLVWAMLVLLFQLLQMTFFALAAVNDLQSDTKLDSTLVRCKDLLFSVFAFPVGTVRTFSNHIIIFLFFF